MRVFEHQAIEYIHRFQDAYFVRRDTSAIAEMLDERVNWVGVGKTMARGKKNTIALLKKESKVYTAHFVINNALYQADMVSETVCTVQGELAVREEDAPQSWKDVILHLSAVVRETGHGIFISQVHMSAQLHEEREALIPRIQASASIEPLRKMLSQQSSELEEKTERIQTLTNNIPGGILQCINSKELRMLQYSHGFLDLIGYTAYEIEHKFQNMLTAFLHPEDIEETWREIHRQLTYGNTVKLEYRCIHKNGDVIWVHDCGQLVTTKDGVSIFNCILTDVTETHVAQEALRLSLERHQIIMDQTENIIFEWDMANDTVFFSPYWERKFGINPDYMGKDFRSLTHIHPEDDFLFQALIHKIDQGIPYCEAEFRIQVVGGHYTWFRIRVSLQMDRSEKPIKAVGVIIDIDREKREIQHLLKRAERDCLTGLYNKGAVKLLIEKYLDFHNCRCALLVLDIDNFKKINDQHGHLSGDLLLSNISRILQNQFRDVDLIGRIGGDEFVVLLSDLECDETVVHKCEQLLKEITSLKDIISCEVSCSIGIAMCPRDGRDYMTLFRNADFALYGAKMRGKNTYTFNCASSKFILDATMQQN